MTTLSEDRRPALRPPQFHLSTLLGVMAVLCALLAAMKWIGPLGAFALLLLVLLVLAHVSGNAIGVSLRRNGDRPVDEHDQPVKSASQNRKRLPRAGPSRLSEKRRLGILVMAIVVLAIAACAGGGAWWTLRTGVQPAAAQDVALAAAAFGVLGGIWGLIIGGFVAVGVGAWREALKESRRSS